MRSNAAIGALGLGALFYWLFTQSGSDSEAGDAVFNVDTSGSSWDDNTPLPDFNMRPTQLSDSGLNALIQRETINGRMEPFSYPDHKGRSIGYGHLIKPGESFNEPISETIARSLLENDVAWATDAVVSTVTAPITQNQFDALVSFCYNVGAPAFKKSTLIKKINNGDSTAAQEFARWVYASGAVNNSLIARRESEVNQFLA